MRQILCLILSVTLQSSLTQGACQVEIEACRMPFQVNGQERDGCILSDNDNVQGYICTWSNGTESEGTDDARDSKWGFCNGGCLDQDGQPIVFALEMNQFFCKTKASDCVFPFTYNGQSYDECVEEGDKKWCATAVHDNGNIVDGFWGWCDRQSCESSDDQEATAMAASVKIENQNAINADITFEQEDEDAPLVIKGQVSGLAAGLHGFHIHELANDGDDCNSAGGHYNPYNVYHASPEDAEKHVGDFGNIDVGADGIADIQMELKHASLYGNEKNIIGRTLVIHSGEDDLGTKPSDPESLKTGNAGTRLACAIVMEVTNEWNLTLIIIIVLVVVIVVLVLLICCLCCFCCLRKKKSKKHRDDPDYPYQNGTRKTPLYDELSIPFIDASPVPTPKAGRSTDRLSFFHRSASIGRSRGSLSSGEGKV